ncbi:Nfam1 [Columba guinea]|nr:Nfam1 [Columba guinea]
MFRSCEWEVLERSLHILQASDFYWGPLSVGEAHAKLQREPVGTYLVRDSSQGNCLFSLSVRMPTGPVSLRISFQEGYFRLKNWFSDCVVRLLELVVAGTRNNPLHFDEMGGTPLVFSEPLCRSRRAVPTLRELCCRSLPASAAVGDTAGQGGSSDPYGGKKQNVERDYSEFALLASGEDVDVQQNPPIQVALLKEGISIPCKVTFPYIPKYTTFSIIYYWINSLGQKASIYSRSENVAIPSGKENTTATVSYDHRIMSPGNTFSTGTYYCEVKWNDIQKMGKGVFVLARARVCSIFTHSSFSLPPRQQTLCMHFYVESVLLVQCYDSKEHRASAHPVRDHQVENRMAEVGRPANLVLCPRRNQLNILRQKVETQPPPVTPPPPPPPSSVYDSLDLQHVDVYSVLENDTNNLSPRKSPPGKTPKKQATLDESCDTLYENI